MTRPALLVVAALACAALATPFASAHPDGLDRTLEQRGIAGSTGSAPMAGYVVLGVGARFATPLAGLIGVTAVLATGALAVRLLRRHPA